MIDLYRFKLRFEPAKLGFNLVAKAVNFCSQVNNVVLSETMLQEVNSVPAEAHHEYDHGNEGGDEENSRYHKRKAGYHIIQKIPLGHFLAPFLQNNQTRRAGQEAFKLFFTLSGFSGVSPSRFSCLEIYQWLKEDGPAGLFKERHICAPPYILLDNRELRAEYLAGNLDGGTCVDASRQDFIALNTGGNHA
jgi:hypothetical protein